MDEGGLQSRRSHIAKHGAGGGRIGGSVGHLRAQPTRHRTNGLTIGCPTMTEGSDCGFECDQRSAVNPVAATVTHAI